MSWNKLSPYATTVSYVENMQTVTYHSTAIVRWNHDNVILNSGGWQTATTKKKMNQASRQYNLGYTVYQVDFEWFVTMPDGSDQPFTDGIIIPR